MTLFYEELHIKNLPQRMETQGRNQSKLDKYGNLTTPLKTEN